MKILFTGLLITTASACVQTENQPVSGKPGFEKRESGISQIDHDPDHDLDQNQAVVVLASQHVSGQLNSSLTAQQS
ncbi:hypothetical protein MNBD_GAMMA17-2298 [hydrothermal vent metagenome]|uniref:Uncharacterized protein n=1 Tax=hydrothermal vent metagenome TaxID=652676 RepID=A0A3B1A6W1_9ZZZZ